MMEKKNNVSKKNTTTKKDNTSKSNSSVKKVSSTNTSKNKQNAKSQNNIKETKVELNETKHNDKKIKNNVLIKENNKKVETISANKKYHPNNDIDGDFGSSEIRKLLIIIGAVCVVMLAFYFITEFVLKNKKDDSKEPEIKIEPTIQYEQILMGSLFNQNEDDYYVLVYDEDDKLIDIYNQYLQTYKNSEDPVKVYKVNLSEDFNKTYINEESYLYGSDITKIKVTGTTLIRISEKEIYKAFEGYDEIISRLKFMLKKD